MEQSVIDCFNFPPLLLVPFIHSIIGEFLSTQVSAHTKRMERKDDGRENRKEENTSVG